MRPERLHKLGFLAALDVAESYGDIVHHAPPCLGFNLLPTRVLGVTSCFAVARPMLRLQSVALSRSIGATGAALDVLSIDANKWATHRVFFPLPQGTAGCCASCSGTSGAVGVAERPANDRSASVLDERAPMRA